MKRLLRLFFLIFFGWFVFWATVLSFLKAYNANMDFSKVDYIAVSLLSTAYGLGFMMVTVAVLTGIAVSDKVIKKLED